MMFNGLKWALYVTVCQNECHYLIECKTNHLQRYKISSPPLFFLHFICLPLNSYISVDVFCIHTKQEHEAIM